MEQSFLLCQGELKIPCRLSYPDDGDIRRIVLGVHGLGGSIHDEIQSGIAEEMTLFRAATLRFDFPGHGESPLDDTYLTVANCVESLLTAAGELCRRYPDVEDLCIFATGFGAYITLLALEGLEALPFRIRLVVQTPAVMMHETLLAMRQISKATLWAMDRATFRAERPFDVTYHFYEELAGNIALTSYNTPMLILHGEEDAYIQMEHIQHFRRINERSKLVIIPGTTHRFQEDGAWDMVLDLTRDWFEFEQVLVTDWE